ncbi:BamA/TamA family outer membrane protein [Gelidibacter japonicus]|uniref:BamA/TamA family outer membrane protein n=1 Tax=Gelidibacter japonicus TaxID=1962232 RepID=UPI0013D64236|nr:BamA/TamA family outer membrane protein [Gelidibacter japonicus]
MQKPEIIKTVLLIVILLLPILSFCQYGKQVIDSMVVRSSDSVKTKKLTFNGYPYAFYTPETQAAIGAGGIFLFYTSNQSEGLRPSKVGFGAFYTTNKQYKFSVNPSIYFNSNKLVMHMPMSFGYAQDKFWGVGNETVETGTEEYFREDTGIQLEVQVPPLLFFSDRSGFILDYKHTAIVDRKDNQFLIDESVNGTQGGNLFGLGMNLIWDRRDNLFYPTSGHYQYIKFIAYTEPSDYTFTSFELDVRYFKSVFKKAVLASNLYIKSISGNAPFYELAALGGHQRMRGYFQGRYRDKNYMTLQTEYRQYFTKRLGFVAFGGIGDVSNEITDLSLNDLKFSFGGGLRYLFNKKEHVNLRMDIGFGPHGHTGIYFGIEEAF